MSILLHLRARWALKAHAHPSPPALSSPSPADPASEQPTAPLSLSRSESKVISGHFVSEIPLSVRLHPHVCVCVCVSEVSDVPVRANASAVDSTLLFF